MNDVAIRVKNLSKRYEIGALKQRHDTLRDELTEGLKAIIRRSGERQRRTETIWALQNVSFEVHPGEVVGVIGRNGAGKSTLLKIISRITTPTAGYAEIRGRMGSLLEVGIGFHPELTGRDNIYLNGAVLGMKKSEIDRNLDAIIAFAETEKFIDTPVKRYSSGMYVRLAFAVAAHLEPELLIVDEVLAVGDVSFQKKCLGKMREISENEGRTILFVSHNMDAIQRLCSRCLFMENGQLTAMGDTATVVARYLSNHDYKAQPNEWIHVAQVSRRGTGQARFVAARYSSLNEAVGFHPYSNGPVEILLAIESDSARTVGSLAVTFYSLSGTKLVNADTSSIGREVTLREGRNLIKIVIQKLHLNPGPYLVGLWLANPISAKKIGGEYDHIQSAFEVAVVHHSSGSLGLRSTADGVVTCQFDVLDADHERGRSCWPNAQNWIRS